MPRGQDPGTITGGAISPFVQKSLQAGKQQSENRLLGAMGEAGATSRATMQEQGATDRTAMQISAQNTQQAARLEADDRRAAEAEIGRREDQKYQKHLQDDQQQFIAGQSKESEELALAREERDIDREDAAMQRMQDNDMIQRQIDAQTSREMNKVTMAALEMGQQNEAAGQKAITSWAERAELAENMGRVHKDTKQAVTEKALADNRLSGPVVGEWAERTGAPKKYDMFGGGAGYNVPTTEKYLKPSGVNPKAILQDQISINKSKVLVEDLMPGKTHQLVQKIASGELSETDIQMAISTLDGMKDALDSKSSEAKGELATKFWKRNVNDLTRMRLDLSQLMTDKTPVGEGGNKTVGGLIRTAFGPIDGTNDGSQIAAARGQQEDMVASATRYREGLKAGMDAYAPLVPWDGASDYAIERIANMNQARMKISSGGSSEGEL